MARTRIVLAGEGGQGVQSIAKILVEAGYEAGKEILYIPNFGVEQRGGVSIAFCQIADEKIGEPRFSKGDIVIGLSSSGVHANGFSLIRKLHSDNMIDNETFAKTLAPVRIYYDIVLKLCENKLIKSCANITGGGILANLKRAVKKDLKIELDYSKIPYMEIFEILKDLTGSTEAYKTFNMGAGFCLIVSSLNVKKVLDLTQDYTPFVFGEIA